MCNPQTFADFFSGIGLFRLGMEQAGWSCSYSVDYDSKKRAMYDGHFRDAESHYALTDVNVVNASDVPGVTLIHASFPCTDLSLAGARRGLAGKQSSALWAFTRLLRDMGSRRPLIVTLENVPGFLTSHNGQDFYEALRELDDLGYDVDALLINASHFVPQSRLRLFVVAVERGYRVVSPFRNERVMSQCFYRRNKLAQFIRSHPALPWNLRDLPGPPRRLMALNDVVDIDNKDWWEAERTEYLVEQMSDLHRNKVRVMTGGRRWSYGTVFRRMRVRDGRRQSTAELRTDGLAGCLRTPKGGSARQILFRAGKGRMDARLLSGRECARLMGANDYQISDELSGNDVLFGFGDAVCVPVVTWLANEYLSLEVKQREASMVFEFHDD